MIERVWADDAARGKRSRRSVPKTPGIPFDASCGAVRPESSQVLHSRVSTSSRELLEKAPESARMFLVIAQGGDGCSRSYTYGLSLDDCRRKEAGTGRGDGERKGRVQTSVIEQRHKAGGYARPAALVVRSLCDLLSTNKHPAQRRPPRRADRLQVQDNERRAPETPFSRCPTWFVAGHRSAAAGATLRVRPPCATLAHRKPHGTNGTGCATRRLQRLAYLARPGRFTRDLLCVSILAPPPAAKSMRGRRRKTGPGGLFGDGRGASP